VRHGMAKAFIVHEEESLVPYDRSAERRTKVILHQVIVPHGVERSGIHESIAQELVHGSVISVAAATSDDVDLAASGAAHLRRIATGLDFELLNRIRRRAQVLGIEGGVGIGRAIQEEVVAIGATSADADRRPLSRTPIK